MSKKAVSYFIIGTFVSLYLMVSVISTIHVIDFFSISNPTWLAVSLAVAFEIGAAASLASLIALDKMNKGMVWGLFIILTLMQAMGNTYYAYMHLSDFKGWVELFGLAEEEIIYQKRILSIISGAVLPIVALGFIKSLVDYMKPTDSDSPIEKSVIENSDNIESESVEKMDMIPVSDNLKNIDGDTVLDLSTSETQSQSDYTEDLSWVNRNRTAQDVDPTKL